MAARLYTHTSAQCSSANVGLALRLAPIIEDSHLHAASILKISEHDETESCKPHPLLQKREGSGELRIQAVYHRNAII